MEAARQEPQRLAPPGETVTPSLRARGSADHVVDLERGGRRHGTRMAGAIQQPIATRRTIAQQAGCSQACLDRIEPAPRVIPHMQAPIEFVSGDGRQPVRQRNLPQPVSYAMHALLLPASALARVAAPRPVTASEPWRALVERLRTALLTPEGTLGAWSPVEHDPLKDQASTRAEVWQRSSAKVAGRHGSLSLCTH